MAGEPGAERRGLVRIVLAELIDEGAGEDRAVAAVRAFNGAAFDVGLAARAVPVLADRPGWAVLAEPDDREILALPERFGPAGGLVSAGRAGQRGRGEAGTLALRAGRRHCRAGRRWRDRRGGGATVPGPGDGPRPRALVRLPLGVVLVKVPVDGLAGDCEGAGDLVDGIAGAAKISPIPATGGS